MENGRLLLRNSTFEDCSLFAEWEQNPQVTEFFTISKGRTYEDVVREFLARENDPTRFQLTVVDAQTDQAIGRIYISNFDREYDSLDITRIYIADVANRGKGFGEEALSLALKFAFDNLKCERVTLDHFTGNKIAAALYLKLGFKYVGVMTHGGKKDGQYIDLHLMELLRSDYYNQLR